MEDEEGNLPQLRHHARQVFDAAVESVRPEQLMEDVLQRSGDKLMIRDGDSLTLQHNVKVIGFGKAVAAMVASALHKFADHVVPGHAHVLVPEGTLARMAETSAPLLQSPLEFHEAAAGNMPDEASVAATKRVLEVADGCGEADIVLAFVSGGGSALLTSPADGISWAEVVRTTTEVAARGASISELNTIRKHISAVKGGQLARRCYPARIVTFVISDVVGDPLDVIASGPFVPDRTTFADCMATVTRLGVSDRLPASVMRRLKAGCSGEVVETPKAGNQCFAKVTNYLVGTNAVAVQAAATKATALGYTVRSMGNSLTGDAVALARRLVADARLLGGGKWCLLGGGETTVTLKGSGRGGRNQELCLAAALKLHRHDAAYDTCILSGGTDGQDGPTPAAGAVVDRDTVPRSKRMGLDAEASLSDNDSFTFFERLGQCHLLPGLTGTNVMDIQVVLVDR